MTLAEENHDSNNKKPAIATYLTFAALAFHPSSIAVRYTRTFPFFVVISGGSFALLPLSKLVSNSINGHYLSIHSAPGLILKGHGSESIPSLQISQIQGLQSFHMSKAKKANAKGKSKGKRGPGRPKKTSSPPPKMTPEPGASSSPLSSPPLSPQPEIPAEDLAPMTNGVDSKHSSRRGTPSKSHKPASLTKTPPMASPPKEASPKANPPKGSSRQSSPTKDSAADGPTIPNGTAEQLSAEETPIEDTTGEKRLVEESAVEDGVIKDTEQLKPPKSDSSSSSKRKLREKEESPPADDSEPGSKRARLGTPEPINFEVDDFWPPYTAFTKQEMQDWKGWVELESEPVKLCHPSVY